MTDALKTKIFRQIVTSKQEANEFIEQFPWTEGSAALRDPNADGQPLEGESPLVVKR